MLVVFAGRPGVGKTTLSRLVSAQLRAAPIRVDAIESAVVRSGALLPSLGPVGYVVPHEVAAGAPLRVVEVVLADTVEHRRVQQR